MRAVLQTATFVAIAILLGVTTAKSQSVPSKPPTPQVGTPQVKPKVVEPGADQLRDSLRKRGPSQRFPASLQRSFTAPALTAAITARKLNALRENGLTATGANLGSPIHLAPFRHTIDAETYMAFAGETPPALALPPATSLPGAVTIAAGVLIELNFRSAGPFHYHLVECLFDGPVRELLYFYRFPPNDVGDDPGLRIKAARGGWVTMLLEPRPSATRRLEFAGNGAGLFSYHFAGCEITPLSP